MRPHQDIAQKPHDISEIITLALEYNPNLAMADLSTVRMWMDEGCDKEKDILPIMKSIIKKKPSGIDKFRYFTNAILEARDKRLLQENQSQEKPIDDARRYDVYSWKKRMGITLSVIEEELFTRMEAKENPAL